MRQPICHQEKKYYYYISHAIQMRNQIPTPRMQNTKLIQVNFSFPTSIMPDLITAQCEYDGKVACAVSFFTNSYKMHRVSYSIGNAMLEETDKFLRDFLHNLSPYPIDVGLDFVECLRNSHQIADSISE